MAPKRKKAGLTRMDAAVDQMGVYGFQSQLVRKTVRSLLKVYGIGNHGWPFIEENAYKVLIETILQEQVEETEKLIENASTDKVVDEDVSIAHNAESSEPPPLSIEGPAKQACDLVKTALDSSSHTLHVYVRKKQGEETQKLVKEALLPHNAESSEAPLLSIKGTVMKECDLVRNMLHLSSTDNVDDHNANEVNLQNCEDTLRVCDAIPTRKRKSCNGWISDDDEDDEGTNASNEANLQNCGNASRSLRVCDVVPIRKRNSCNGWISDDDDEGTNAANVANLQKCENTSRSLSVRNVVPIRKRKPCYGWISDGDDDDDGDDKFLELAPAS